jgi:YD repeat-containing protein
VDNQSNELTSYTSPAGPTSTYAYDGDGLRTAKTPSGGTAQAMTWDVAGGGLLLLSAGSTCYVYGPAGTPIEQIDGTSASFLHQDQLGSTSLITDAPGALTGSYRYDPYGQATHGGTATSDLHLAVTASRRRPGEGRRPDR